MKCVNVAVSVVVPVYNREQELPRCIDSVRSQSFPSWELILINDGSDDASGTICDTYADADERIRVIHHPNRGVSAARNQGMRAARGSYICFLDSDDWIDPDLLRDQYLAMTRSDVDLVISGLTYDYPEKQEARPLPIREGSVRFPQDLNQRYSEWIESRILNTHCAKLYKKEIIDRYAIRMNEGFSVLEDSLFLLDYLMHCTSVYCLPSASYHYRQTSAPTLQKQYHPDARDAWEVFARRYAIITEHLDQENTRRAFGILWYRYRGFLIGIYAGSNLSARQKHRLLKRFLASIHDLAFFDSCPRCPERGMKKRLIFFLVRHKLACPLHLCFLLRYRFS